MGLRVWGGSGYAVSEDCDCRTVDVRCVWVGYGHASESVGGFVARARDSPLFIVSSRDAREERDRGGRTSAVRVCVRGFAAESGASWLAQTRADTSWSESRTCRVKMRECRVVLKCTLSLDSLRLPMIRHPVPYAAGFSNPGKPRGQKMMRVKDDGASYLSIRCGIHPTLRASHIAL